MVLNNKGAKTGENMMDIDEKSIYLVCGFVDLRVELFNR